MHFAEDIELAQMMVVNQFEFLPCAKNKEKALVKTSRVNCFVTSKLRGCISRFLQIGENAEKNGANPPI